MTRVANIRVPSTSAVGAENFALGIEHGVWGWKASVLAKPKPRDAIGGLFPGQGLLLALGGPNPRRSETEWTKIGTPVNADRIQQHAPVENGSTGGREVSVRRERRPQFDRFA